MNRHAYILVFDRDDFLDYTNIHNKIISIEGVVNWFHYIKSSYILITEDSSARAFAKKIQPIIPNKNYLLVEINLENRQGCLPQRAWDWIYKQVDKMKKERQ